MTTGRCREAVSNGADLIDIYPRFRPVHLSGRVNLNISDEGNKVVFHVRKHVRVNPYLAVAAPPLWIGQFVSWRSNFFQDRIPRVTCCNFCEISLVEARRKIRHCQRPQISNRRISLRNTCSKEWVRIETVPDSQKEHERQYQYRDNYQSFTSRNEIPPKVKFHDDNIRSNRASV